MKRSRIDSVHTVLSILVTLAIMTNSIAGPWMVLQSTPSRAGWLLEGCSDRAKTGPSGVPIESRSPQATDLEAFAAGGGNQAERGGFEPPWRFKPPTAFPVLRLQPLGHLSTIRLSPGAEFIRCGVVVPPFSPTGRRMLPRECAR